MRAETACRFAPMLAAAVLAGCAVGRGPMGEAKFGGPAAISLPRAAPASQPDAAAALNRLKAAVQLVTELRYGPASDELVGLEAKFRALGDDARAAEAVFWLGFCNEKLGRSAAAVGLYRRAVELYSTTPAARQARDRLNRLPPQAGP